MVGRLEESYGSAGQVVSGTTRVALGIGCLVMVLVEAESFKNWLEANHTYYLASFGFECNDYQLAELLLFLLAGVIGVLAACKSHLAVLKMFTFLIVCSLIFSVIVQGFTEKSSELDEEVANITKPLEKLLKHYDWTGQSQSKEAIEATKSWDATQKVGECCGLAGLNDWDATRPRGLNKTAYPASCCAPAYLRLLNANELYCHVDEMFKVGCRKSLKGMLWSNRLMAWIWKIFYLVLLLLSIVLLYDTSGAQ